MPPRAWRIRIEDMLDATQAVLEFVGTAELEEFREDRRTVDAVVRNLEVIGEAAGRVPESPWADIVSLGKDIRVFEAV